MARRLGRRVAEPRRTRSASASATIPFCFFPSQDGSGAGPSEVKNRGDGRAARLPAGRTVRRATGPERAGWGRPASGLFLPG